MEKMKSSSLTMLRIAMGVALISGLFSWIGWSAILAAIQTFNPIYLIPATIFFLISLVIATYNIKLLTDPFQKIAFGKLWKYTMLAWSIGSFIPGKLGEFSLVWLLRKEGIPTGKGTAITIMDKIITAGSLASLAIIGFFLYFEREQAVLVLGTLFIGGLAGIFAFFTNFGRKILRLFIPDRFLALFTGFGKALTSYLVDHPLRLFTNIVMTYIKWLISAFFLLMIFYGFDVHPPILTVGIINATGIIISFIPLTIAGLGFREAGIVWMFSLQGISSTTTASVMLLWLVIAYTFVGFFLALYFEKGMLKRPREANSLGDKA
ncbi:MAG: flippase-like domain-containing protein [DPANN group archaeon]|nr:flippase-like domain-containing protein [DPANN group archaeon]